MTSLDRVLATTAPPTEHVVAAGESYWRIAERQLTIDLQRDPSGPEVLAYTDQLIAANAPRLGRDQAPSTIHPGDTIELVESSASAAPATPPDEHLVVRGDSYWRIADHELRIELGREPTEREVLDYTNQLIAQNAGRLGSSTSPAMLHPGDTVVLHAPPSESTSPPDPPVSIVHPAATRTADNHRHRQRLRHRRQRRPRAT